MKTIRGMALTVAFAGALAASAGSLKWTGGAGTMNWGDAANWTATDGGTVDFSVTNDYDFTDLAADSTIVNSRVLKINSLTFAENQGTITLDGSSATATSEHESGTWTIPAGTTVDYKLYYWKEWGNTGAISITGAGRVKFSTTRLFSSGRNWQVGGSVVFELAVTSRFLEWGRVFLNESAKLVLSADNTVNYVSSSDFSTSTCVDVGSHTLKFYCPNLDSYYRGTFVGTGTVYLQGGRCLAKATDWSGFTGLLSLANYSATSLSALGGTARLKCRDNGMATLVADQTLASLEGEGTTGGVSVPSGKTLTVGAGTTERRVFNARLTGAGGLTKTGAASELVLGGANDYTGATTVREGTLTAANAVRAYPAGLVNRWSFEGDFGRFDDSGPACNHLTYKHATPSFSPDGVGGSQCVHFDRAVHSKMALQTYAYTHLYGTNHFTISAWFRPEEMGSRTIFYGAYKDKQVEEFYCSLNDPSISQGYTVSVGGFGWCSMVKIATNQWHHLVLTQTAKERIVYIDGTRRNAKTVADGWQGKQWTLQIGGFSDWNNTFQGDIDEVLTFDRALSAAEVKSLYETPIPYAANDSAAALLPQPVAHWAFDDKTNLGKDSSGNGYDLTATGRVEYVAGGTDGIPAGGGGAKMIWDNNPGGFRWGGEGLPAKFPRGKQSFAVSVRMAGNWEVGNGGTVFSMGDMKTANAFFAVMYGGDPKFCGSRFSVVGAKAPQHSAPYLLGGGYGAAGAANSMSHLVIVWNATTGYFSIYCDGVLAEQRVDWKSSDISLASTGSVLVGLRDDGTDGRFYGCIDDVQVFDRALSSDEVRALTRQLSGLSAGAALSKVSAVSVEASGTLRVLSQGEQVKTLSGAGTLSVGAGASLEVTEETTFAGAVQGGGTLIASAPLTLSGDGSAFTGKVATEGASVTLASTFGASTCALAEGCVLATDLDGTGLPLVATAGALTLPAQGTVRIDATADELAQRRHTFVLARAGTFGGATDFAGWTVEPASEYFTPRFAVKDGAFVLTTSPRGMCVIFR